MSTKYCPSSMALLLLPSLHGHIIGRIQTGNSFLNLLHSCCIAFLNKLKAHSRRPYVINIKYVFSNYMIPVCKLQNLLQVGKNWGQPRGCTWLHWEDCISKDLKSGTKKNAPSLALEAIVYSVAVCFSTETGSCCRRSCWNKNGNVILWLQKSQV